MWFLNVNRKYPTVPKQVILNPAILQTSVQRCHFSFCAVVCGTAVCFLHVHEIGIKVWLPKVHNTDLESVRPPAKSASWNTPCSHLLIASMTLLSVVSIVTKYG